MSGFLQESRHLLGVVASPFSRATRAQRHSGATSQGVAADPERVRFDSVSVSRPEVDEVPDKLGGDLQSDLSRPGVNFPEIFITGMGTKA